MGRLLKLNTKAIIILYIVIDIACVGAGMGVPIFCILLGFPAGWYITKRALTAMGDHPLLYRKILRSSVLASAITFLLMVVVWGRVIPMLFDPSADFLNFGHPFILYDPRISLIGWLILMIFISPFLQLLAMIYTSFITLTDVNKKNG